ncbi:MAG TPA: protein phosphatase 2C domain-containing protein [Opitutaceae bacterium]|nr:protein phosphatase 2C domain-containing protein [Opitutaceae bacterium]
MSAAPAPLLAWSGATDRGPVRANNEDSFLALAFDAEQIHRLSRLGRTSLASTDCVFAVSDGMGGARSGEFASRITLDQVMRLLPRGFRRSAGGTVEGFGGIVLEIFQAIHRDLLHLGRSYEECAGMGATLSLGWFTPGAMYFGHVGDSRIYHLPRGGGLVQLTHDHSHVGWLRRSGKLNEREARSHPGRNALQQVLGAGHQFLEPQVGGVSCAPGDRFLFCTDGLVDGLWDARLEEALRQGGEDIAAGLVREAVAASGRDNATAVEVAVLPPS